MGAIECSLPSGVGKSWPYVFQINSEGIIKQERATYVQSSGAHLAGSENYVHFLQEEIQMRKKWRKM